MAKAAKRVTIDAVAKRAEVSISTVSRVLNNLDRVHPVTRKRVQDTIAVLGYEPSAFARGLALQRTHTIGCITPNVTDPFFSDMVRGVEDAAVAANHSLLISSQHAHQQKQTFTRLFTQRRVDGMVLVAINIERHDLDELLMQGYPVAVIQQDLGDDVPTFVADNDSGACALTEHLVAHGYRRIAYIAGDDSPDNSARLRCLKNTLAAYGLPLPDDYIVQGDYSPGSGYQPMCRLLELRERPEAVFAANDQMAADAIQAARAYALTPPHDIAIVGFDDIFLARYLLPPLTTVHQPTYDMGRRAVEAIIDGVDNQIAPRRVVLPTQLIIRESCGCSQSYRIGGSS